MEEVYIHEVLDASRNATFLNSIDKCSRNHTSKMWIFRVTFEYLQVEEIVNRAGV